MSNNVEFAIQCEIAGNLDARGVLWAASMNGLYSNPISVKNAKRAGLKTGHPDIAIYEPRMFQGRNYHALFIELKKKKGKRRKDQIIWINELEKRGYRAVFAYGLEEAERYIEEYLK